VGRQRKARVREKNHAPWKGRRSSVEKENQIIKEGD